ncbi:hypothetical protein J2X56_004975 [Herbaspirillum sp. 1173]|uniref:hypothetical protein n=1 Tax=Herbaspirillum sp. 1173 TaxID=2817734 RepID=UPI00285626C4|nr:hypothetical protein [Herbaspirillum sp. 1173]MDR6742940.1 hypothetical protein [Herbaspirillum sp. 1173]
MINPELRDRMNLSIALETMELLQQEGGDLGSVYWYKIAALLKEAEDYRERAAVAEEKLARIKELLDTKQI